MGFVVFSVVEIFVDYGVLYVFHVCSDLCVVYGVRIRVDVSCVVCVLKVVCFMSLGAAYCVVTYFRCVGYVLSVMRAA